MHGRMREMVDEEKEGMLKELLKQMYDRMSDSKPFEGKETPEEEASEEMAEDMMSDGIKEAEGEEMAEENEGGDVRDEISSFMKNKHRPAVGKTTVMVKLGGKPMIKSKSMKGRK